MSQFIRHTDDFVCFIFAVRSFIEINRVEWDFDLFWQKLVLEKQGVYPKNFEVYLRQMGLEFEDFADRNLDISIQKINIKQALFLLEKNMHSHFKKIEKSKFHLNSSKQINNNIFQDKEEIEEECEPDKNNLKEFIEQKKLKISKENSCSQSRKLPKSRSVDKKRVLISTENFEVVKVSSVSIYQNVESRYKNTQKSSSFQISEKNAIVSQKRKVKNSDIQSPKKSKKKFGCLTSHQIHEIQRGSNSNNNKHSYNNSSGGNNVVKQTQIFADFELEKSKPKIGKYSIKTEKRKTFVEEFSDADSNKKEIMKNKLIDQKNEINSITNKNKKSPFLGTSEEIENKTSRSAKQRQSLNSQDSLFEAEIDSQNISAKNNSKIQKDLFVFENQDKSLNELKDKSKKKDDKTLDNEKKETNLKSSDTNTDIQNREKNQNNLQKPNSLKMSDYNFSAENTNQKINEDIQLGSNQYKNSGILSKEFLGRETLLNQSKGPSFRQIQLSLNEKEIEKIEVKKNSNQNQNSIQKISSFTKNNDKNIKQQFSRQEFLLLNLKDYDLININKKKSNLEIINFENESSNNKIQNSDTFTATELKIIKSENVHTNFPKKILLPKNSEKNQNHITDCIKNDKTIFNQSSSEKLNEVLDKFSKISLGGSPFLNTSSSQKTPSRETLKPIEDSIKNIALKLSVENENRKNKNNKKSNDVQSEHTSFLEKAIKSNQENLQSETISQNFEKKRESHYIPDSNETISEILGRKKNSLNTEIKIDSKQIFTLQQIQSILEEDNESIIKTEISINEKQKIQNKSTDSNGIKKNKTQNKNLLNIKKENFPKILIRFYHKLALQNLNMIYKINSINLGYNFEKKMQIILNKNDLILLCNGLEKTNKKMINLIEELNLESLKGHNLKYIHQTKSKINQKNSNSLILKNFEIKICVFKHLSLKNTMNIINKEIKNLEMEINSKLIQDNLIEQTYISGEISIKSSTSEILKNGSKAKINLDKIQTKKINKIQIMENNTIISKENKNKANYKVNNDSNNRPQFINQRSLIKSEVEGMKKSLEENIMQKSKIENNRKSILSKKSMESNIVLDTNNNKSEIQNQSRQNSKSLIEIDNKNLKTESIYVKQKSKKLSDSKLLNTKSDKNTNLLQNNSKIVSENSAILTICELLNFNHH